MDCVSFQDPLERGIFTITPPKFSEWNVRTIAVLDLYNVDEDYLSTIFHEGITKILRHEHLSGEAACSILENYGTENIKAFAQDILQKVVQEYLASSGNS